MVPKVARMSWSSSTWPRPQIRKNRPGRTHQRGSLPASFGPRQYCAVNPASQPPPSQCDIAGVTPVLREVARERLTPRAARDLGLDAASTTAPSTRRNMPSRSRPRSFSLRGACNAKAKLPSSPISLGSGQRRAASPERRARSASHLMPRTRAYRWVTTCLAEPLYDKPRDFRPSDSLPAWRYFR